MLFIATIVIIIQMVAIILLLGVVLKLRARPDFAVFQALQKEALKSQKDYQNVQKAFDQYRNRGDILIISGSDPIDIDAVTGMTVTALEMGAGVYGTASNVEAFVAAAYDLKADEEAPSHIKHIIYGNRTQLALYTRKLPKQLQRIIDGDL